jgi:ketosteroid isomerase-like protein
VDHPSDPRVSKFAGAHGRQEFLDVMRLFTGFFSQKLTFTAVATTCEGNRVALEAEPRGVAQEIPFFNRYHLLFEFQGNRIAVAKEYMDSAFAVWFNAEITRRTATFADRH